MRIAPLLVLPLTALSVRTILAQSSASTAARDSALIATRDSLRIAARCDGRTVTAIDIDPEPPGIMGDSEPGWKRTLLSVASQHVTTKTSVIRPFLLLEPGQPCTEFRRAESERILRAQPFLAEAHVRAIPVGEHETRIEVRTVDEIPIVAGGEMRGSTISAVTFGNSNVLGHGLYLTGNWRDGFAYRDGYGGRFVDYHTFGRPYRFSVSGQRDPHSTSFSTALGHEFLTNLQRSAWHLGYSDVTDYVSFRRPAGDNLSLNMDRQLWDVGGVGRIGLAGKRAFAGLLLTHEHAQPAHDGVILSDSGLVADTNAALHDRFTGYESLRLSGVIGARLLSFMPVHGFDALTAEQDMAKGAQLGMILGRGLTYFGSSDRDNFASADLYAGVGTPASFLGLRVQGEGREDRTTKQWNGIVASGRLAWYLRPSMRQTIIASGEFSGAWRSLLPFQLALGDAEGGVRGYGDAHLAGGQRAVARLEDRWVLGHLTQWAGIGAAAFVDAGKVWAGDVPFGETTAIKTSVGIGLLAAVPPTSQRLLRVDFAVPVSPAPGAKWQILLSVGNTARMFWREPADIARVRTGLPASSIFSWP
ncbi:MAG TPA: BamA/TamA family outer membrane protein [Gemmatimonadaceae bacterium]